VEELIAAIDVFEELQVPPEEAWVKVVVCVAHTDVVPPMGVTIPVCNVALTATVLVVAPDELKLTFPEGVPDAELATRT
jgi:hypothetical protein